MLVVEQVLQNPNCSTTTVLGDGILHKQETGHGAVMTSKILFSTTGGRCSVRWDLSSFTADSKANEWNTLASNCGTYYINARDLTSLVVDLPLRTKLNKGWHE